jgi:hypothetical protein
MKNLKPDECLSLLMALQRTPGHQESLLTVLEAFFFHSTPTAKQIISLSDWCLRVAQTFLEEKVIEKKYTHNLKLIENNYLPLIKYACLRQDREKGPISNASALSLVRAALRCLDLEFVLRISKADPGIMNCLCNIKFDLSGDKILDHDAMTLHPCQIRLVVRDRAFLEVCKQILPRSSALGLSVRRLLLLAAESYADAETIELIERYFPRS